MNAYLDAARSIASEAHMQRLVADLVSDIGLCEEVLRRRLGSKVATVEDVGRHVAEGGGKRLRPLLVSLGARATGRDYIPERVSALGACVEMIHMATLIHDDVIDRAPTRRNRPTPSAVWGPTAAILSGDVLLARAMEILAEDGDLRIIRCVSRAVVAMAEGEVREVETRGDFYLSFDDHLEILRSKTASFLACCCRVGGMIAGASPEIEQALSDYGQSLGTAFQIADDLLDFVGEEAKLGKSRATDFCEGCATLPLILLRESADEEELAFVKARFGNGALDGDLDHIASVMRRRGAFEAARREAETHSHKAVAALGTLPETDARKLLESIASFAVSREA